MSKLLTDLGFCLHKDKNDPAQANRQVVLSRALTIGAVGTARGISIGGIKGKRTLALCEASAEAVVGRASHEVLHDICHFTSAGDHASQAWIKTIVFASLLRYVVELLAKKLDLPVAIRERVGDPESIAKDMVSEIAECDWDAVPDCDVAARMFGSTYFAARFLMAIDSSLENRFSQDLGVYSHMGRFIYLNIKQFSDLVDEIRADAVAAALVANPQEYLKYLEEQAERSLDEQLRTRLRLLSSAVDEQDPTIHLPWYRGFVERARLEYRAAQQKIEADPILQSVRWVAARDGSLETPTSKGVDILLDAWDRSVVS